ISCNTLVAVAVTDKSKGNKGITAFIFDKALEGFRSDKKENKLGMRASETASVVFEDCYVPDENRLGNEGEGFLQAMQILDGGRKVTKQSAMAKLYASEVAVRVSEESIQIHGGYGYTKDYPAEKYWRDSKLCTIGEGTSEIQRMVIARQLLNA